MTQPTTNEFLDAILAEQDDSAILTSFNIEDILNDKTDFEVEPIVVHKPQVSGSIPHLATSPNPIPISSDSVGSSSQNGNPPKSPSIEPPKNKSMVNNFQTSPISQSRPLDLASVMNETEDLELGATSNVNMDELVKSILSEKTEGVKDVQFMKKVQEYETRVADVADSKLMLKTLEERRKKKELNASILQSTRLDKIAAQLSSANIKKAAGSPTCIAASSKYIAIGSNTGLTIVFNHFQELVTILGTVSGVEYGRVYSVAIAPDSDFLATGHHLGQVVIWDLEYGKPVKILTNDPPINLDRLNVPVTFVDFIEGKRNRIIACSLDGVLNIHTLSKVFLVTRVDTTSILTGESGTGSVLAVAPLHPGQGRLHPIDVHSLIACATFKRIVVFPSNDKTNIIFHLKKPPQVRDGALPYFAWRDVVSPESKNGTQKLLDPVLAIGWGNSLMIVQIIQAVADAEGRPIDPSEISSLVFRKVAVFQTDTEIDSLHWLGSGILIYTTSSQEMRVFDPFAVEDIEIDPIKNMEVVFHTKFSGSRAVSSMTSSTFSSMPSTSSSKSPKAAAFLPPTGHHSLNQKAPGAIHPSLEIQNPKSSHSYHSSIASHRGKLYIMGSKAPYVANVLGWSDRIAATVEKGKWLDALAMALDFYQGRAKAVKGLPRDPQKASSKILNRITELLHDYVKVNLSIPIPKDPTHFEMVATVCIDYCLILGKDEILFQTLFPLFQQRKKTSLLLEKLEPFILGDQLRTLPPDIIQQIVKYYSSDPVLVPKLEQLLLHIDLGCIDFHATVKLCIKHHLSTALFHLYIEGLSDYITPMDMLMKVLVKDMDLTNQFSTNPERIELKRTIGYKVIYYLSNIFRGKSFPSDQRIPLSKLDQLREDVFAYLLHPKLGGELAGERYPRIRVLLHIDSKELLDVFRVALDGMSNSNKLKQIVDIFIEVMVDPNVVGKPGALFWSDKPSPSWPFSPAQIAHLYHFIANYYSSGALDISDDILRRLTGYTLLSMDNSNFAKREKMMLDILRSCPEEKLEYNKLALLAESAKFYKVCDFFFTYRRDYGAVIRCHILDPDYRKSIFSFVKTLMTSTDPTRAPPNVKQDGSAYVEYMLTDKEKSEVKNACIEKIIDLIKINNEKTAYLMVKVLQIDQSQILTYLDATPEAQFLYLKACLSIGLENYDSEEIIERSTKRPKGQSTLGDHSDSSGLPSVKSPLDFAGGEKLLELYCRFDPKSVLHCVREYPQIYRLDVAIDITRHFNILPAYCFLQETAGDMAEVVRFYMAATNAALEILYTNTLNTNSKPPFGINGVLPTQMNEEEVQNHLDEAIAFCKRNHKRMGASEGQQVWFSILDVILLPLGEVEALLSGKVILQAPSESGIVHPRPPSRFQQRSRNDLDLLKYHLNKLISRILDSMIGFVDLQAILEKILKDRVDSRVGDFRDIFVRLLENYTHERDILFSAVQVLRGDSYTQFSQLVTKKRKGIPGRYVSVQSPKDSDPSVPPVHAFHPPEEVSNLQLLRDVRNGAFAPKANNQEIQKLRRFPAPPRVTDMAPSNSNTLNRPSAYVIPPNRTSSPPAQISTNPFDPPASTNSSSSRITVASSSPPFADSKDSTPIRR